MEKKFRWLFFIILLSVLAACGEYPCIKGDLRFNLIGFSDAESDTIIVRRKQKGTSIIIDTSLFSQSNPIVFVRFGDTLRIAALSSPALLVSNYDYQIYFPGASRTFNLTEIVEQVSSGNKSLFNSNKTICVNPILSCKIDGQLFNAIIFPNSIYLRK